MKTRTIRKSRGAVPVEHPDGGVFHIRAMTFDEAVKYSELVTKEVFERDDNGTIIFNPKGEALKRYAGGDVQKHIDFAIDLVEDVDGVQFDDEQAFEPTRDNLRMLLTLMGTDEWEIDVPIDAEGNEIDASKLKTDEFEKRKVGTKKAKKPVHENLFIWVTRKSAQLAEQQNTVAKGN